MKLVLIDSLGLDHPENIDANYAKFGQTYSLPFSIYLKTYFFMLLLDRW